MIDIVDIKSKVKSKELEFYLLDGNIYCKNKIGESVLVGSYQEIVINNNGIIIREKGKSKQVGYTPDSRTIHL